ncbi:MAG: hypothetical protein HS116_13170 [Planctomycetes bacterium]|nr:hypothetical protein [Planctomycetota bacterium]
MFNSKLQSILSTIGQAAAEVECLFEGNREFISLSRVHAGRMLAFKENFPYFADQDYIYRVVRLRVESKLIDDDHDFSNSDFMGMQSIYLPSEEAVEFIFSLWKFSSDLLDEPRNTDVPI